MIYTSKEECYQDILMSLSTGILVEQDIAMLKEFYQEIEHYECCQGIVEAYVDYKKLQKEYDYSNDDQE